MRLLRMQIKPKVELLLEDIAQKYAKGSNDYVKDLYTLLRRKGKECIPTDKTVQTLAQAYSKVLGVNMLVAKATLGKRRELLMQLVKSPFFLSFMVRKKANRKLNVLEELRSWLLSFVELAQRQQVSQCISCSLLQECDFGKEYGKDVVSIVGVIDEKADDKVHKDCPCRPEITAENEAFKALQAMANAASVNQNIVKNAQKGSNIFGHTNPPDPDELSPAEMKEFKEATNEALKTELSYLEDSDSLNEDMEAIKTENEEDDIPMLYTSSDVTPTESGYFDGRNLGSRFIKLDTNKIAKMAVAQLAIYNIIKKIERLVSKAHKGKFEPTSDATKNRKLSKIESVSDVSKLHSGQHGLPEEVFDAKLAKKTLVKRQDLKRESKVPLLYFLLDDSYSMFTTIGGTALGYMSRASLAQCFALALLKRVRDDGGFVFTRFFDANTSELINAKDVASYERLEVRINTASFDGSSTNIVGALARAIEDVELSKNELSKAEILMITDGESNVSQRDISNIRSAAKSVVLSCLDLAPVTSMSVLGLRTYDEEEAKERKKRVHSLFDHVFLFEGNAKDIDSMVTLVGKGKKQN